MTTSPVASPAPMRTPRTEAPHQPTPRPPAGERQREHGARGEDFARVLRQKSASRDDDDARAASDEDPSHAEPAPAALLIGAPMPSARRAEPPMAVAAGGLPAPSETAARLGRAAAGEPSCGGTLGLLRQDVALSFEMTLNDPRGIALELRAHRAGGSQVGAAPAPWSLTIGSGVVDASVLARHAPRLNERLQARVVTHGHVRIEGHAGADERDGERGREGSA